MSIEEFKKGLILNIDIENLNIDEIKNLDLSEEVKKECIIQIQNEVEESGRPSDIITWKNQWRDHIPD